VNDAAESLFQNLPTTGDPGTCAHAPDWLTADRLGKSGVKRPERRGAGGLPVYVQDYEWTARCRHCGGTFRFLITSYDDM
jgi:hypothetical protein